MSETTPLERAILTHYWCCPDPWKNGSEHWKPVECDIVDRFVGLGLLLQIENPDVAGLTKIVKNEDALRPYMEALAAVPLPVQRWIVP